jgi:TPR repeat protein
MATADDTYVASIEESWNNAQKHYAKGQFQSAFSDFYWAAIRDHPQAQQMVGLMYLLGPEAFGPGVKRDRVEADFWMHTAQIHGADVNEYLRCAITRKVSERNISIADRALACLVAKSPDRQTSASTKASSTSGIDRTGHH